MRPIDADVLIPLIQEDKIEGKTLDIVKALGDGLQAETLNQACDRHIKIINGLPTIATTQEVHGTAENFTAPMEKGKTMTTKEKILLYFRDINYAYNDCTRLDSLEKGLSELEEVVRCKDCRWWGDYGCAIRIVDESDKPKENDFCSFGKGKTMYDELIKRLRSHNGWALNETLDGAADAIEGLQAQIDGWIEQERNALLKSIPKWIPVTERLPEPNAVDERGFVKAYLVKTDRHVMMHTARWDGMYWILWGQRTTLTDKVTHWMPLPEPPKEES